jgi:hypothetical protein
VWNDIIVYIDTLVGKSVQIAVGRYDTVFALKLKIQAKEGKWGVKTKHTQAQV